MLLIVSAVGLPAAEEDTAARIAGHIGQISGDALYIDLGREDGLTGGDTLAVSRAGVAVGRMIVTSTARRASACRALGPISALRVGDRVTARVVSSTQPPTGGEADPVPSDGPGRRRTTGLEPANRLRGRIFLSSLLSDDLTGSGLDFAQPALYSRVTLDRIAGTPVALSARRARGSEGRRAARGGDPCRGGGADRGYELVLESDGAARPSAAALGRFTPDRPRGIGLIDGLMRRFKARAGLSVGVVGGTRPDPVDTAFRSGVTALGLVTDYERPVGEKGSATLSGALVGSYAGGEVDREYVYVEGDYNDGGRFFSSNSIELDVNRGWRGEGGGAPLTLTGAFLTARYRLRTGLTARASYDTRRAVRSLDNRAVPDSLFDDAFRRGFHAGAAWSASPRIHLSGGFGVRVRAGAANTLSGTGSVRLRQFPVAGVTTTARIALFRSMLGRGYRPTISAGLSPIHGLALNLRGGDTIYETSTGTEHNPWIGTFANYRLSRRHYLSASFTGYLSDRLRSARLFAETGLFF